MATIKVGVYAIEFLDKEFLTSLVRNVRKYMDDHNFRVYTFLPGQEFNGGREQYLFQSSGSLLKRSDGSYFGSLRKAMADFNSRVLFLAQKGVSVDLAITNHEVEEDELGRDLIKNTIDNLVNCAPTGEQNGLIYVNDCVGDFARENYGDALQYIASIIKFYNEFPEFTYRKALDTFDRVVVMHQDIEDIEKLVQNIPLERRGDAYILSNTGCKNICGPRDANIHYKAVSEYNRMERNSTTECKFSGKGISVGFYPDYIQQLVLNGFDSFKIGRYVNSKKSVQLLLETLDQS